MRRLFEGGVSQYFCCIFLYCVYHFLLNIDKTRGSQFSAPVIINSRQVIMTRYGAILDKSERVHLYRFIVTRAIHDTSFVSYR